MALGEAGGGGGDSACSVAGTDGASVGRGEVPPLENSLSTGCDQEPTEHDRCEAAEVSPSGSGGLLRVAVDWAGELETVALPRESTAKVRGCGAGGSEGLESAASRMRLESGLTAGPAGLAGAHGCGARGSSGAQAARLPRGASPRRHGPCRLRV